MNSKKESIRLAILIAIALASVCLILGVTMWLVPWGGMTAAGILVAIGVTVISIACGVYARNIAGETMAKKGIDKTDDRYKYAKDKAMALVGKVAVALLFGISVLMIVLGKVSAEAFFAAILGFFVLFMLVVVATLFYINKL
ncbi:MAG: hypothetical protein ACOYI3_00020 [Christensenellales bacterium]|jgi:hypothetical protein